MTAGSVVVPVLVLAGILGLVIGSFLNVVIVRVPAGVPLTRESRCPRCDARVTPPQNVPVVSWIALRGRCASCGEPISVRYPLVEVLTGGAFIGVAWLFGASVFRTDAPASAGIGGAWVGAALVVVAFLYLAAISVALTFIDLDTHRLPNTIVLPSYAVAGILFTLASVSGHDWPALLRAAVGGAVLYGFYLLLRSIRRGGMGGGDVKLAGVLGIYLGWLGWGPLTVGTFAAFLLGGMFGIILLAFRRAGRTSAIPFGPWMLAGAWVGILFGERIATWYLGLVAGT
ncbi:A24 family peptidase [Microbacterium yannicii]|uniref:Prepilin leader peptidase/N-methyltransferase n=1 Tax=Microbacterium yannicii TaxID=671622 RepID=A0ABP9MNS3_9MICO|nr:A24 family peptidase [Microbacterium yannicii]MCO5951570.1 prepilin peptidase [Microbacterium yannicii]